MIRITNHPTDPTFVCVHAGPEHAHTMGGYGPARWAADRKIYLLAADRTEHFTEYVTRLNVAVLNDRDRKPGTHPSGPLPECANCGQPAKRNNQPAHCPACGERWSPTVYAETTGGLDWRPQPRRCAHCGGMNVGAFTRCAHCGAELTVQDAGAHQPPTTRAQLHDPLPIAATLDDWLEANRPTDTT